MLVNHAAERNPALLVTVAAASAAHEANDDGSVTRVWDGFAS